MYAFTYTIDGDSNHVHFTKKILLLQFEILKKRKRLKHFKIHS